MKNRVGALAAAAAAGALVLGMGGLAFACIATNGPYVNSLEPNRGLAGTQVTVSGGGWAADSVSIRWASATGTPMAPEGAVNGPSFSVRVQIPTTASPSVYKIYVSQGSETKATPFEVTSNFQEPSDSTPDAQPEAFSSGSTVGGTGGGSAGPSPQDTSATSSGSAPAPATRTGSGGIPAPSAEPAAAGNVDGPSPAVTTNASPPAAASAEARPQGLSLPGALGTSRARGESASSFPSVSAPAAVSEATADVFERAGRGSTAELWSGVDGGANRSRFGLGDLRSSSAPADETMSPMAVLVPMLLLGGFALLAGFAVAERRRSRVAVRASAD